MKLATLLTTSFAAVAIAAPASVFAQCQSSRAAATPTTHEMMPAQADDIVDVAIGAGSFNTLVAAVKAAGLVDVLKGEGPFTVFAPTDAAFAKLPKSDLQALLKPENKGLLTAILTYHVVPGKLTAADVIANNNASTANGQQIAFNLDGENVTVDNATVVQANINASNGVIHVIDEVIMPSTNDIISTAVGAGSFTTLATALDAAALISALQGDGPFTVFAPTDEAFKKLPKGTVESLLEPRNRNKLTAILKYHVVPGRVYARDAIAAQRAGTLEGSKVRVGISNEGRLTVNGANVIAADIDCTNGVIHIIDEVILP